MAITNRYHHRLFFETLVLCPSALVFLLVTDATITTLGALDAGLLFFSGIITLVPLFAMVAAVRRIQFNTLGFLQYITPIGHFLITVLIYEEKVSLGYGLTFTTNLDRDCIVSVRRDAPPSKVTLETRAEEK